MLSDLTDIQSSDESVQSVELSFDIETRSEEADELIQKVYTFSYAEEWDKWTFVEYCEKRTPDTTKVSDRNWRKARHIYWDDTDTRDIEVPPEVAKSLADATGSDSVTIQTPTGSVNQREYQQFTYEC